MGDIPRDEIERDLRQMLASCRTASLATLAPGGAPHAANVQVVADSQLRLYWVSSPDSAHSVHLARDPRVAATVYGPGEDRPDQIHGVQIGGQAVAVEGPAERERAWRLYAQKYPFAESPPFREMVDRQRFYRLTPTWLRWIDNRRGFGFSRELPVAGGS
ncbi:MAG: pyridoxamine 5'-phosphate oxidase family protein [Phycisphaeraceae bacterium]